MIYAPITIPTLNRYEHFCRLMESLKRNSWARYTDVIIGLDYPPTEKYREGWEKINEYLDSFDKSAFNNLIVLKWSENLGAGRNNSKLAEYVIEHYDRYIRCDDDCEFSPNFLEFMDKCLERYEDDEDVIAVTGYSYPVNWSVSEGATCMRQNFNVSTWGLGLWNKKKAGMTKIIRSGKMLSDCDLLIKTGKYKDMLDSTFEEYFRETLKYDKSNSVETHVTDCAMTAYLAYEGKYCISPIISKVRNWGFDGSGITCAATSGEDNSAENMDYTVQEIDSSETIEIHPNSEELLKTNWKKINDFDVVPPSKMAVARLNFKLIKHFGKRVGFAIRMVIAGFNRIKRKLHL